MAPHALYVRHLPDRSSHASNKLLHFNTSQDLCPRQRLVLAKHEGGRKWPSKKCSSARGSRTTAAGFPLHINLTLIALLCKRGVGCCFSLPRHCALLLHELSFGSIADPDFSIYKLQCRRPSQYQRWMTETSKLRHSSSPSQDRHHACGEYQIQVCTRSDPESESGLERHSIGPVNSEYIRPSTDICYEKFSTLLSTLMAIGLGLLRVVSITTGGGTR
jgi:hypothetical protein